MPATRLPGTAGEFFRFELREQLRSPLLWLMSALFALLAFGATSSDAVQLGGGMGNVVRNAPTVIVTFFAFFTLLGMLVITLFISAALLRDFELGTDALVFASPVRRRDYLLGRIGAALAASLVVYLLVGLGMFVAQFMPWIDPVRLGPVSLQPYLWGFAVIVLPNLLFTGALLALLAVITRSVLWVYIGVLAFLVLYGVSAALLRDLDNVWVATLVEPLGVRALSRTFRYWSSDERNHSLPTLGGYLLANRALWLGVAGLLFAATFALFRTERTGTSRRLWGRKARTADVARADAAAGTRVAAPVRESVAKVVPARGPATAWRQFAQQARFDTVGVFRSVPFLVMLAFGMVNFVPSALLQESLYGTRIYPVTSQMVGALEGSFSFLLMIIVMFYAGELVWKERSARIDEVSDAAPVPNWVPLLAKFAALVAVIVCFQGIGALTAMVLQLAKGYTQLEPLLYAKMLAVDSVVYVLMAGLALALQVFSNNKFVGYALLILVLIGQSVLGLLDFSNNLYNFGSWPNAPHSDINGYGHFLPAQLWFQAYWALFMVALLLLAAAFRVRGVAHTGAQRRALAAARMHGPLRIGFVASLVAFAAIGGWLFWNTNVRNDFTSPNERLDLQARYEREYKDWATRPQPRIQAVSLDADLRPETPALRVAGHYRVRNTHPQPLSQMLVGIGDDRDLVAFDAAGSVLVKDDKPLGVRVYRFRVPLAPGW